MTVDRLEENDTPLTASNLGTLGGPLTIPSMSIAAGDLDWFRFTLAAPGRTGDLIAIAFSDALGDLDLLLFDESGAVLLDSSMGIDDVESISLAGLPAGSYTALVGGYAEASNPDYTLRLAVAPAVVPADPFEDDDMAATATDLGAVSGTLAGDGLSIAPDDPDWFRFTLPGPGRSGDHVSIAFEHTLGDLDLALVAADGVTLLDGSAGVGNVETLDLQGWPAGTYYAVVYGYDGESNPEYSIEVVAAPAQSLPDALEDDDSPAGATPLGTIDGTLVLEPLSIEAGDPDWFAFTLDAPGRDGDVLAIRFNGALGDLDLGLVAGDGQTLIDASEGVGDEERISLAGLPAGSYYALVAGWDDADNPEYALEIAVAPRQAAADRFEDDDGPASATDLRTVSGTVTEADLSIEPDDPDWFRFTLAAPGRAGDTLGIAFNHALGDLDLGLVDGNGTALLASSEGVGDEESISLDGLAAGTYYALVAGYDGASNPQYALSLRAAPAQAAGDRFEDNDSAASATDLRTLSGPLTQAGLSIASGDADWFRFTLAGAARPGDTLGIGFNNALGDLDLELFDATGTARLGASEGVDDVERIDLDGLPAGTYLARVHGYGAASNPEYSLSIAVAASAGVSADRWEANDTIAQATALRESNASLTGATLTAGDVDWYGFTVGASGAPGDRVTVQASGAGAVLTLANAGQQVLATQATDAGGSATIALDDLPAGSYFARVTGESPTAQATYDLEVRAGGETTGGGGGGGGGTATLDDWSILVFVNGDNDLERFSISDVNEMEAARYGANINVAVQLDRHPAYDSTNGNWTDARRGVIVPDGSRTVIGSALTSIGEVDMGSGQALLDFLNWSATNVPARNYALVIWDHGAGALDGASFDASQGNSHLSTVEITQAIAASTMGRVAILGFDACLMGAIEVASASAPVADRLVAAERTEPGDGWDYTALLNTFSASASGDGATLAASIVDAYDAWYRGADPLSAVSLADVAPIEQAISGFVAAMAGASAADWQAAKLARERCVSADDELAMFADVVSFMTELRTASTNPAVDAAAQQVIDAVRGAIERKAGPADLHGLTVVFPRTTGELAGIDYTAGGHRFLANTTWDDFLQAFVANTRAAPAPESASIGAPAPDARAFVGASRDFAETLDIAGNPRAFANDTLGTSLDLGTINQADYRVAGLTIDTSTDVDCFRFTLPSGAGFTPSLSVMLTNGATALSARLFDSGQNLVAQSEAAGGRLTFTQLVAGQAYFVQLSAAAGTIAPAYELRINAFGDTPPLAPPADFGEAAGGNNALGKAFRLGDATQLERVGPLYNLSFDGADLKSGATGGDWFRVESVRVVESNANRVTVDGGPGSDLDVRVYDVDGRLLAEATDASTRKTVTFARQVDDVFVQVTSGNGAAVAQYSLQVENAAPLPPPVLSIAPLNASRAEGNAGATSFTFTVTRTGDTGVASTASWAVSGAAVSGADFSGGALPSGTVSFAAGEASKVIAVPVAGDAAVEADEAFTVTLSGPGNATLGTVSALGGILNDDADVPGVTRTGTAGADTLTGSAGSDTINGLSGNDILTGLAGNDLIDGGAGLDTARYDAPRAQAVIHLNATTPPYAATVAVPGLGTDTLSTVERLRFSDLAVAFDVTPTGNVDDPITKGVGGNAGKAYRLYQAALARTPDLAGLGYWISEIDNGAKLFDIATGFLGSPEFATKYGANPTNQEYTRALYMNVLGREPDANGYAYWNALLDGKPWNGNDYGSTTRQQMLVDFSESTENKANAIELIGNGFDYLPWG